MREVYLDLLNQFELRQKIIDKADPKFSLFPHIEATVGQVVGREKIASMNPQNKELGGGAYREESVEIKLTGVTLEQLTDLMYQHREVAAAAALHPHAGEEARARAVAPSIVTATVSMLRAQRRRRRRRRRRRGGLMRVPALRLPAWRPSLDWAEGLGSRSTILYALYTAGPVLRLPVRQLPPQGPRATRAAVGAGARPAAGRRRCALRLVARLRAAARPRRAERPLAAGVLRVAEPLRAPRLSDLMRGQHPIGRRSAARCTAATFDGTSQQRRR